MLKKAILALSMAACSLAQANPYVLEATYMGLADYNTTSSTRPAAHGCAR
ncbi:hypothetical protein [Pseudoduganella armeniaca]|nr:hypothetical protein [Pseudoduganella armeniaca]